MVEGACSHLMATQCPRLHALTASHRSSLQADDSRRRSCHQSLSAMSSCTSGGSIMSPRGRDAPSTSTILCVAYLLLELPYVSILK